MRRESEWDTQEWKMKQRPSSDSYQRQPKNPTYDTTTTIHSCSISVDRIEEGHSDDLSILEGRLEGRKERHYTREEMRGRSHMTLLSHSLCMDDDASSSSSFFLPPKNPCSHVASAPLCFSLSLSLASSIPAAVKGGQQQHREQCCCSGGKNTADGGALMCQTRNQRIVRW